MQRTNAMRDFRDAKTMAQTLRESLTGKAVNISHSESLELVSKMLGVADWNTLSALLQVDRRDAPVAGRSTAVVSYPAIPLRDLVPFPTVTYPLFVGREKTMLALKEAFERQREVVLAVQRYAGASRSAASSARPGRSRRRSRISARGRSPRRRS
jgi:ATP-dependent Lon protease